MTEHIVTLASRLDAKVARCIWGSGGWRAQSSTNIVCKQMARWQALAELAELEARRQRQHLVVVEQRAAPEHAKRAQPLLLSMSTVVRIWHDGLGVIKQTLGAHAANPLC